MIYAWGGQDSGSDSATDVPLSPHRCTYIVYACEDGECVPTDGDYDVTVNEREESGSGCSAANCLQPGCVGEHPINP